jgi:acyl dehydratase
MVFGDSSRRLTVQPECQPIVLCWENAATHAALIIDEEMNTMARPLYLEDLTVGQTFRSGTVTMEPGQLKAFSAEFDPQPFHLDEDAAGPSLFGELVASGWHTAALTMKLLVESDMKIHGGLIGVGVDELNWPRPVRPGDTLRVESEVLDVRPSKSLPERGIVKVRNTTLNQNDQPVLIQVANLIVPRRPS